VALTSPILSVEHQRSITQTTDKLRVAVAAQCHPAVVSVQVSSNLRR
jgi:hypothetical protein